jgi:hypothetical protein
VRPEPPTPAAPPEAPSWWKPWTWRSTPKAADVPTLDATPDAMEVGAKNNGFALPGSGQEVGGDGLSLSVGGSPVQSGNPLPVKIDKIEPGAGGVGGLGGGFGGGDGGSGGGVGGGAPDGIRRRSRTGGVMGEPGNYDGGIDRPNDRRGKTGNAGFGLYATDVGLAHNKSLSSEARAFLDTIGTGETPSGSYSNIDNDPGGLGGRYQFLKSTWVNWARKIGVSPKDFTPDNQDAAAFKYADTLRQKTGVGLEDILKEGPDGVRRAIAAVSPGAWNAITNIDRDKANHSGAVHLFLKKLHDEQNAQSAAPVASAPSTPTPRAPRANIHVPNVFDGVEPSEYPAPNEHVYSSATADSTPPRASVHRPYTPTPYHPHVWSADQFQSAMLHHYDNSDNSVTHHHNYNTNVAVNGVSDPQEAAAAVGSTLDQVFSKSQTKTRMLQGAIA